MAGTKPMYERRGWSPAVGASWGLFAARKAQIGASDVAANAERALTQFAAAPQSNCRVSHSRFHTPPGNSAISLAQAAGGSVFLQLSE